MSNYDEALERFQRVDLEYSDGLTNHGPMGAEALESLGHHALIPAFTDVYVPRLPALEPGRALGPGELDESLGDFARRADWIATFERRVARGDWRAALAVEVPPLLPGLFAGAGHGLLRVAHAARALEREDSVVRRRELAFGLAHWASRFQTLPGLPGSRARPGAREGGEALGDWPLVDEATARIGNLSRVVARLETFRDFTRRIEMTPLPIDATLEVDLDALCLAAARLYVDHPRARIAYVHALTIPSGLRLLAAYLPEEATRLAVAYAFQATGALHSIFGERGSQPEQDDEVERIRADWDEIRYHAACSLQEHSIKMAEACWREDRRRPDPIFRRAAADAALKIEGRGQASVC